MATNQISRKSEYLTYVFVGFITLLLIIILIETEIIANPNSNYLNYFKCVATILIVYPLIRILFTYLKYFVNYMFCVPNTWWNREVQRPRLLFNLLGALLFYIAIELVIGITPEKGDLLFITQIILSYFILIISILSMMSTWTKWFEKSLVKQIRRKLVGFDNIKCIINENGYNLEKIISEINNLEKGENQLICNLSEFIALTKLEELNSEERIQSFFEKSQLIRLVYILFNLDKETKPALKRELINSFFVNIKGEDIILEQEALFSRIDNEITHKKEKFTEYKVRLSSIFQDNRKV